MFAAALPAVKRRTLLGCGVAATLSTAGYRRILGANDRVGLGFIGFGLIGKRHVLDFQGFPGVDLVAVAEVHKGRLEEAAALMGAKTRKFGDFRGLIDDRDFDAVIVSTPDHWHTLMTMMACAAGKDVYVEKPLSLFIREGRWMVEVARRHRRVVQVGTQQRSGPHYLKARELIRGDTSAESSRFGCGPTGTSSLDSAHLPMATHLRDWITTTGWARRLCGSTTRTGRSTTSDGSGTIPADR
jgi:predicted dehydrogenase